MSRRRRRTPSPPAPTPPTPEPTPPPKWHQRAWGRVAALLAAIAVIATAVTAMRSTRRASRDAGRRATVPSEAPQRDTVHQILLLENRHSVHDPVRGHHGIRREADSIFRSRFEGSNARIARIRREPEGMGYRPTLVESEAISRADGPSRTWFAVPHSIRHQPAERQGQRVVAASRGRRIRMGSSSGGRPCGVLRRANCEGGQPVARRAGRRCTSRVRGWSDGRPGGGRLPLRGGGRGRSGSVRVFRTDR